MHIQLLYILKVNHYELTITVLPFLKLRLINLGMVIPAILRYNLERVAALQLLCLIFTYIGLYKEHHNIKKIL